MAAGIADELGRVRGFVRGSSPLYLLFLVAGVYLGYPTFGIAFWGLIALLVAFAAVDVYVLRHIADTTRRVASGDLGEPEARRAAAALSRILFVLAGFLAVAALLLIVLVAYP